MQAATITSKGQVTIPKAVRDALNLKEHDQVIFVVDGDRAIMKPVPQTDLEHLRGILRGRQPHVGRDAERAAVREHVVFHVLGKHAADD